MEEKAGVHLVPGDIIRLSVTGEKTHPGAVVIKPSIGKRVSLHQEFRIKQHGHIENNKIIFRDRAIVDHGLAWNRN